jgi:hypothetical protein
VFLVPLTLLNFFPTIAAVVIVIITIIIMECISTVWQQEGQYATAVERPMPLSIAGYRKKRSAAPEGLGNSPRTTSVPQVKELLSGAKQDLKGCF